MSSFSNVDDLSQILIGKLKMHVYSRVKLEVYYNG